MGIWERSPLTGELRILAVSRSDRPNLYRDPEAPCPFCSGNEEQTPPTLTQLPENGAWSSRAFANRYPLTAEGGADSVEGWAEVIVETARHDVRFEDLQDSEGDLALEVWQPRLQAHRTAPFTMLFKNEGRGSGASIPHAHSQLVTLRHLPPRSRGIVESFAAKCPVCAIGKDDDLLIETDGDLRFASSPSAPLPWQTIVFRQTHEPELNLKGLFPFLARALGRVRRLLDTDYNLVLHHYPFAATHWFIEITPRVRYGAGLEIGSGLNVSHRSSKYEARTLRER